MNENKCDDCPNFKTFVRGWRCCTGNSCENDVRADERKKVLEEVREITKTIEASDILARAESCDKNCCECDGCLTRIVFEQLKGGSKWNSK